MHVTPRLRSVTDQRLSRLRLWLCLMVTRIVAHLVPSAAHRVLTQYAHAARLLLVASALKQCATQKRRHAHRIETRPLTVRRVCGAALRRAFRGGTPQACARAICAALAAPQRWIAAITRRLRRRFTKLARLPAPQRTRVKAQALFAPALAVNSS